MNNVKLPHWAMAIIAAIGIVFPWLVKQETAGVITVPPYVIPVESGILTLLVGLGLLTPSVLPNVNAQAFAKKMALKGIKVPLAMFSFFIQIPIRIAGLLALCLGLSQVSCDGIKSPSTGVVSATVQTITCIITTTATDLVALQPWPTVVVNDIATCGTDAATVATVWDAHVKAEVTEGVVPKYALPDGGLVSNEAGVY